MLTLVGRAAVAHVALPYGRPAVALVPSKPLIRVVPVGRALVERVVAPSAIGLPVHRGQQLGRVEIWAGNRLLGARPLVASRTVTRPGVGGRLRWYATRTVHDFLGLFS
jgi:hypothetical protein